jgi:mono/diheme cytochrome c family protein
MLNWRILRLAKLGILLLLLAACQNERRAASETSPTAAEPIVPNLPSISELAGTPAPEIPALPTLATEEIATGQELYEIHCAECHGKNLEGEADWQQQNPDGTFRAPPHDAGGHTWHHGDQVLIESIELGGARLPDNIGGTSEMPAFGDTLTEEQITAVLSYIKSTWPEDMRAVQWEQTVREQNQ